MRFTIAVALLASALTAGVAFAPSRTFQRGVHSPATRWSTVDRDTEVSLDIAVEPAVAGHVEIGLDGSSQINTLSAAEINARLEKQLAQLSEKDATSPKLSKEDLKIVFEDEHIVIVNKPSGVLCVPNLGEHHNLAQAVCDATTDCSLKSADHMVVHRIGMDTSGLVVFAKTVDAVRDMNAEFRSRKVEKKYEALVCGHMEKNSGIIDLPLMRDYESPLFMRISTDAHQGALADLNVADVSKALLEQPKDSLTKYEVVRREEFEGQPVTRVKLSSISGRTHQLNVHLAAYGHPIVGDTTYGIDGSASPNGGLSASEREMMAPNGSRASDDLQQAIASAAKGKSCVHAKSLKFRHPVTLEVIWADVNAPF